MTEERHARIALTHQAEQAEAEKLQWQRLTTRIACSGGSCKQGRERCKTEQACEVAEEESARPFVTLGLVVVVVVACAMALPSFIHFLRGFL